MKTYTSKLTTTIENSDDGLHNYSVTRTLEGIEGDKAIVLTLYPSFSGQDLFRMDSTAMHMTNHLMNDLQISSVKVINLFSKIVKGSKMSCRGAEVDEENLKYIENLMKQKDFEEYIFIVAWGSSMSTCKAAIDAKERIMKMYMELHPNARCYQFTCDGLPLKGNEAVHPLYLGIRATHLTWKLRPFSPAEFLKSAEVVELKKIKPKAISKKKESEEVEVDNSKTKSTKVVELPKTT